MNLTEQYPSRRVRQLLGFPRSLLYRTPADAADLRAALLRLFVDVRVYHKSTRAASAAQPNCRTKIEMSTGRPNRRNSSPIPTAVQNGGTCFLGIVDRCSGGMSRPTVAVTQAGKA